MDVITPAIDATAPLAPITEQLKIGEVEKKEEAPKEDPKPEAKKEDPISLKFAALAKKERMIVKRDLEIKAREKALEERQKALEEEDAAWQADPLKALERKNLSYQKLTERVLNEGKETPEEIAARVAREENKRFREEEAQKMKAKAEEEMKALQAEQDRKIAEFRKEVTEFVKANESDYEYVNLFQAHDYVPQVIEEYFAEHKKVLSNKEAAEQVEKYLEDFVETKVKASKKFTAKTVVAEKPTTETKSTVTPQRTITNKMTPSAPIASRPMSREERIKRALAIGKE